MVIRFDAAMMVEDDNDRPIENVTGNEIKDGGDDKQKPFGERFPARGSAALRTLAANLRRLRTDRGWSQDTLATAAKIDQNAVSLIENRRSNPTIKAVEKLAKALKVPIAELLTPTSRSKGASKAT